jgi:hypothetical protein
MPPPPDLIGGTRVVRWSVIDGRHRPSGDCEHAVSAVLQGPAAGLAIGQPDGEDAYYLFGCDAEWNSVTDTWHATLEEALAQAESEYEGVSETWNVV